MDQWVVHIVSWSMLVVSYGLSGAGHHYPHCLHPTQPSWPRCSAKLLARMVLLVPASGDWFDSLFKE